MRSVIYLAEKVENRDRRFGAALHYYPFRVVVGPYEYRGLLTRKEMARAIERSAENEEDFPPPERSWWQRLKEWLCK